MKNEKTQLEKKLLLYELVQIVEALFPNKKSENPYFETAQKQTQNLNLEEQLLFHKLLHSLTILNKQSRINPTRQTFETSREDIVNVLHIFKGELAENPRKVFAFYYQLETKFKTQGFTKLEAQLLLRTSRRSVERCLYQLMAYDLITVAGKEKHFGNKNLYQIKEHPKMDIENLEEENIFEEAFREWEDFKGFVEF
jgi:hypothetical protein